MKTREERLFELEYSNEGRVEQCERICNLEEFAGEMFREILLLPEYHMSAKRKRYYIDKANELGIEGWA